MTTLHSTGQKSKTLLLSLCTVIKSNKDHPFRLESEGRPGLTDPGVGGEQYGSTRGFYGVFRVFRVNISTAIFSTPTTT